MAIYKVNSYNGLPTFYVNQETYDSNIDTFKYGRLIVGTEEDATLALNELKKSVLDYEAIRFSICATFVNGNDTVWRAVQDEDPEETVCQVFNTFTGQYTECKNKTEANVLNESFKEQFLTDIGLNKVFQIEELPKLINDGGVIPSEVI